MGIWAETFCGGEGYQFPEVEKNFKQKTKEEIAEETIAYKTFEASLQILHDIGAKYPPEARKSGKYRTKKLKLEIAKNILESEKKSEIIEIFKTAISRKKGEDVLLEYFGNEGINLFKNYF